MKVAKKATFHTYTIIFRRYYIPYTKRNVKYFKESVVVSELANIGLLRAVKEMYLPCHFYVSYSSLNYIIPSGYLKGRVEMRSLYVLMRLAE